MKLSKSKIKFGIGLLLFCSGYWVLDSVWSFVSFERNLNNMIFREPMSYIDTLMLSVPPYQIVSRVMVIVIFIVTGVLIALSFAKHKKAEHMVRDQRDFLNTLLETIPSPVFYKDSDGKYTGCNTAFEDFIGKPRSEIIDKTVHEIAPQKLADQYEKQDLVLFDQPGVQHYESIVVGDNGKKSYVKFDKATLMDKQNNVEGLIGVITDLTERKKAEDENVRLERRLQQSQKMESIGTLAGGIAHDFNNILFGMMGYIELCIDDAEPGSLLYENLHEVLVGGRRAKDLIKQILTFSRQTEKRMQLIQVGTIVKEVTRLLRSTLPTTIDMAVTFKEEDSTIYGDPTQIHQVIINLCTNAFHAMEGNGGLLKISLSNVLRASGIDDKPGDETLIPYLKMSVSDTGVGIPAQYQDRIFDPFFTSKRQGKGLGMGLAMVHGIVKSHKGQIEVVSTESSGTTFDVYWPLIEQKEDCFDIHLFDDLPVGNEHILIVQDEERVVNLQKQLLEKLNYTITAKTIAMDAITSFDANNNTYDAVITDVTLLNQHGDLLAADFKKRRPNIPVILCTSLSEKISDEKIKQMGIDAVIMKPVENAELANTLRRILDI